MDGAGGSGIDLSVDEKKVAKQDVYERKAREQEWRSRSSFKLLQIDTRFRILEGVKRAVDLYASPGLWTQVLSRKLVMREVVYLEDKPCLFYNELAMHQRLEAQEAPEYGEPDDDVKIVAVDAYGIPPYPGVVQVDGDLAVASTAELITQHFEGNKADLVVCNKFINHTELFCIDVHFQANHIVLVLHMACLVLQNGGTLVMGIFKETYNDLLKDQLLLLFKLVDFYRPRSGKTSAIETYAVCRQYSPPPGFDPKLMEPFLDFCNKDFDSLKGINRVVIPFILCGDCSAYPLSAELEAEICGSKFTKPLQQDEAACSSTSTFVEEDLDHYIGKMTEAMKEMSVESDPDPSQAGTSKQNTESESTSEVREGGEASSGDNLSQQGENLFENGPLYALIQRTTKIKKWPREKRESEGNESDESDLQFLYEDEFTDPEVIRECLERIKKKSSTCTCDEF